MPHLAGVFDSAGDSRAIRRVLRRMTEVLSVPGVRYQHLEWEGAHFGAVSLLPGFKERLNGMAVSEDRRFLIFVDGDVFGHSDRTEPDPERPGLALDLLKEYQHRGRGFLASLNGSFNLAVYDLVGNRLELITDRLGSRPLFFHSRGGRLLFGLEQKAILSCFEDPVQLDSRGVFAFITFGHHIDDRTMFEGVRVAPPGSVLEASPTGLRTHQYWSPRYRPGRQRSSEVAAELGRAMVQSVRRRVGHAGPTGIFLSGGLDSRFVAGALGESTTDVEAFTFGPPDSPDVRYATELCRVFGFRQTILDYPVDSFVAALPRVVWRTEGLVPFVQCTSIVHHRHIAPRCYRVLNGHLGDALSGGHLLPQLLLIRSKAELVNHILKKRAFLGLSRLRLMFREDSLRAFFPLLKESVQHMLEAAGEERIPFAYNLWDLLVRQRRYTLSSPAVDRYLFEQMTPFVDNELLDLFLAMPLRGLLLQRTYIRAILDGFPAASAVPWARTGHRIGRSASLRLLRLSSQFAGRRLGTLRRSTPAGVTDRSVRQPAFRQLLLRFMQSPHFPRDLLDETRIAALINDHFSGIADYRREVAVLLTLAEATRLFVQSRPLQPPGETEPLLDPS